MIAAETSDVKSWQIELVKSCTVIARITKFYTAVSSIESTSQRYELVVDDCSDIKSFLHLDKCF
jgi:hypothetical protein